MPAAIAIVLRQLIIMLIQTAAFAVLERLITSIVDKEIKRNQDENGLDEADSKIATANAFIDIALMAGITMISLRTKLPLKIAEKLGFTSRGYVKGNLSKTGAAKLAAKKGTTIKTNATVAETATEVASVAAKTRGLSLDKTSKIANLVIAGIGVPVGVGLLITNTVDFAAWPSSAYQTTFQKLLSKFGINPDKDAPSSKVLSDDMWEKIYNTYFQLGATGVNNPYTNMSQKFSRETLAALVDKVAANIIAEKGKATLKEVIAATQGFITMGAPVTDAKINAVFGTSTTTTTGSSVSSTTTSTTKVFTGIVSQGVVGQGLVFEARPDDMIESLDELRQAASNNLASYLNTLLGKVVYEVKVVSSIITKEGFKQTGITQRIQTGTYSNGTPKYKTVTNKFATIVVYAITDKGSRAKLTTIVLGPVDSAKLIVGQNDLRSLETELPELVTTNDINEINEIITGTDTKVTNTEADSNTQTSTSTSDWWIQFMSNGTNYKMGPYSTAAEASKAGLKESIKLDKENITHSTFKIKQTNPDAKIWESLTKSDTSGSSSVSDTVNNAVSTSNNATRAGAGAKTLYEWYQAQGQTLPSVKERSVIYERLGLGSANYYTGTAEQNTKLLNALKSS